MEHVTASVTDICEIPDNAIISCLKKRYMQDEIYTYVARSLIALNPYHHINGLYSRKKVEEYRNDIKDELPPHLYSIANRMLINISLQPQSIVLTGESGSGKTKSAMYLLLFISKSTDVTDRVMATNRIFETFGNAKTCYNENSSRYTKLTEVLLFPDRTLATLKMSYLLLESSRVYAQNENETNFHIFYDLLTSAAKKLLENFTDLHLDITKKYNYLPSYGHNDDLNCFQDFVAVDNAMIDVGVSNEERIKIYQTLAAILHLGNVIFEENFSLGRCQIAESSRIHFDYAAQLLEIDQEILEISLLTRKMEVTRSDPIIIQLNHQRANKVKNCLCRFLYEHMFRKIVHLINKNPDINSVSNSLNNPTLLHISLLDIAGFESFYGNNHFEQLCINFINEKVQQMFVKIMLKNEEEWYASESLEIPKIQFLDNDPILDVFEHKSKGIYKLLDDTGKMQCQTPANFVENLFENWGKNTVLAKPREIPQNTGFIIQHFVGDVIYNVDNFLEKNLNILPKSINEICQKLGIQLDPDSDDKLTGKSTTFILKTGTDELIKKLYKTQCTFVRCIKPNSNQSSGTFDENLVESQLISSGSIAYQRLMRIGFPSHISITKLFDMFKLKLEFESYTTYSPKYFCSILIRSCGLKWTDFKLGNTQIFFRRGKLDILSEKIKEDAIIIKKRLDKLKLLRRKLKAAIIFARFCVIGKERRKILNNTINEVQPQEHIPRKKFKQNKKSSKKTSEPMHSFLPTEDEMPIEISRTSSHLTTITIQSDENLSTENMLRKLLREEKKKNELLSEDYCQLQKQNVELLTKLQKTEKVNEKLVVENRYFRKAYSYISREHDYQ